MIYPDLSAYPRVVVTFRDSSWTMKDYTESMRVIRGVLKLAETQGRTLQFVVVGNPRLKKTAPLLLWARLAVDLLSMNKLLKSALDRTAIIKQQDSEQDAFRRLFKFYTPIRPVQFFTGSVEADEWLKAGRRGA